MPRSRSSSSTKRSLSTKSTPAAAPLPKPSKAPPPAIQQPQGGGGGMLQGLGSTIMEGFAFGTGSAIARQAVGAVFGGSSTHQQDSPQGSTPSIQQSSPPPTVQHIDRPSERVSESQFSSTTSACQIDQTAFNNCMNENGNMISSCDFLFQSLKQCQSDNNNNNANFSTA